MVIAVRNPIKAKIEDRASFLKHLLQEYPVLLEKWEKETEREMESFAEECAEGCDEICTSVLSQCMHAFDDDESRKDMFYQAVFLMSFSYYESTVALLSSKTKTREHIKAICKSNNISLTVESEKDIDYIQDEINALRNNIIHNNMGTYKKVDTLKNLAKKWNGLHYENDSIWFTDPEIIEDAINKMHHVLSELCDKLGYKTKFTKK